MLLDNSFMNENGLCRKRNQFKKYLILIKYLFLAKKNFCFNNEINILDTKKNCTVNR